MKIVFLKPGKYRVNSHSVVEVGDGNVKEKSVYNVEAENGLDFIKAGKAAEFEGSEVKKEPEKPKKPVVEQKFQSKREEIKVDE